MRRLWLILLLTASPVAAQTKLTPKDTAARVVDNCAPIGRTAKGEMVYSMKCDNLPVPPPSQTEAREAPAAPPPEPEARGGLFGWSYDRRPKTE